MPLTNQSEVIQNSAKDAERSFGSNFDLLIISKGHCGHSVHFMDVSLLVPKVTGSLAVTLFSQCRRPTFLLH